MLSETKSFVEGIVPKSEFDSRNRILGTPLENFIPIFVVEAKSLPVQREARLLPATPQVRCKQANTVDLRPLPSLLVIVGIRDADTFF